MANAERDQNFVPTLLGVSNADGTTPVPVYADPTTHRLLVDLSGGSGTVTTVSVVTANGFAGTVANATTTPAITIQTTITGIIKGNGTAISAAVAGDVDSILPTQTGNNGKFLTTNGTNSSWGVPTVSGYATVALDNLASVAINTALLPGTAGALDFGSATKPWAKLWFAGTSGTPGTNNFEITGASTSGTRIITAPDRSITLDNITTATTTNGTGFLKGNGSVISFDNSTYLTTLTVGATTITSGTTTRILYDNAGTLGEYTLTGSGTVVAMQTAPSFLTSITTPSVLASSNGSGSIGASGTAFSNLYLASGATINFSASNVVLTHSTGILTQTAGELRITSANVGTNADSVPTLSSTSTLTNKTLTSPTIQTSPVLAAATNLKFTVPSSDDTATGITTNEFNSGYTSTAIGDLVYLDSSATWQKADADASAATYSGYLGIALEVKASGNAVNVLLQGYAYCSTAFPTFTIGSPVYMSATAGAVTQTAPTTTDSATRVIGFAIHADKMWFNPSNDYITHA